MSFQEMGKGEEERKRVIEIIDSFSKESNIKSDFFLKEIENRSGILIERSIGVLGFSHLTLQEFLCAEEIHLNLNKYYPILKKNINQQSWREIILLLSGLIGDSSQLVKDIALYNNGNYLNINELHKQDNYQINLAANCIADSKNCDDEIIESISNEIIDRIKSNQAYDDRLLLISSLSFILRDSEESAFNIHHKISNKLISEIRKSIKK